MTTPKTYTAYLVLEGDDLVLPLPPEMVEGLGWQVGDTLRWIDNTDGTFSIVRAED